MSSNFVVMGRYSRTGISEVIDAAYNAREAQEMVREYQIAYGSDWHVWYRPRSVSKDGAI